MRRAAATDANQSAIVDALRKAGASVQSLSAVGAGCPDLLVGFRGRNWLMEVKLLPARGRVKPSEARLNPAQKRWTVCWRGEVALVRSVDDALAVIGLLTR